MIMSLPYTITWNLKSHLNTKYCFETSDNTKEKVAILMRYTQVMPFLRYMVAKKPS